MNIGKTDIFPPVKVGGQKFSVGRALRFCVGLFVIVYTLLTFHGAWQEAGIRYLIGALLVDYRLVVDVVTAWKSRNGR